MYAHDIIGNLNAGMNGYIDWNLLLDEEGGSNHVGNFCEVPIMYDLEKDDIDVKLSFYYIGHFSKFVEVGAKRILVSRYTDKIESVGFLNPDGKRVLVILNKTNEVQEFLISEGVEMVALKLEAYSIMTACW